MGTPIVEVDIILLLFYIVRYYFVDNIVIYYCVVNIVKC